MVDRLEGARQAIGQAGYRFDALLTVADPVLAGAWTLPKAGDRIRETVGAQAFVYELMALGNEPPWRYSDPYRKALRIHTKHVAME